MTSSRDSNQVFAGNASLLQRRKELLESIEAVISKLRTRKQQELKEKDETIDKLRKEIEGLKKLAIGGELPGLASNRNVAPIPARWKTCWEEAGVSSDLDSNPKTDELVLNSSNEHEEARKEIASLKEQLGILRDEKHRCCGGACTPPAAKRARVDSPTCTTTPVSTLSFTIEDESDLEDDCPCGKKLKNSATPSQKLQKLENRILKRSLMAVCGCSTQVLSDDTVIARCNRLVPETKHASQTSPCQCQELEESGEKEQEKSGVNFEIAQTPKLIETDTAASPAKVTPPRTLPRSLKDSATLIDFCIPKAVRKSVLAFAAGSEASLLETESTPRTLQPNVRDVDTQGAFAEEASRMCMKDAQTSTEFVTDPEVRERCNKKTERFDRETQASAETSNAAVQASIETSCCAVQTSFETTCTAVQASVEMIDAGTSISGSQSEDAATQTIEAKGTPLREAIKKFSSVTSAESVSRCFPEALHSPVTELPCQDLSDAMMNAKQDCGLPQVGTDQESRDVKFDPTGRTVIRLTIGSNDPDYNFIAGFVRGAKRADVEYEPTNEYGEFSSMRNRTATTSLSRRSFEYESLAVQPSLVHAVKVVNEKIVLKPDFAEYFTKFSNAYREGSVKQHVFPGSRYKVSLVEDERFVTKEECRIASLAFDFIQRLVSTKENSLERLCDSEIVNMFIDNAFVKLLCRVAWLYCRSGNGKNIDFGYSTVILIRNREGQQEFKNSCYFCVSIKDNKWRSMYTDACSAARTHMRTKHGFRGADLRRRQVVSEMYTKNTGDLLEYFLQIQNAVATIKKQRENLDLENEELRLKVSTPVHGFEYM